MSEAHKLNPFSSRFVSPLTCRFIEDKETDELVKKLSTMVLQSGWVQLVGPDGCGKTTLAREVARRFQHEFRKIQAVTVRLAKTRWPFRISTTRQVLFQQPDTQTSFPPLGELVLLDGMEQLSMLHMCLLIRSFGRRGIALIATTHRPIWLLPNAVRLEPSLERFRAVADDLLSRTGDHVGRDTMDGAFDRCQGNYRKALNMLYDHIASTGNS